MKTLGRGLCVTMSWTTFALVAVGALAQGLESAGIEAMMAGLCALVGIVGAAVIAWMIGDAIERGL